MQVISGTIIVAAILGLCAPALSQTPGAPAASQAPSTGVQNKDAHQIVCTMEPITGSRVKKRKVCRDAASEKSTERDQDSMRRFQNGSGNMQPVVPGGGN